MPSNAPAAEPFRYPVRLLLVLCEHSEPEVRRILAKHAHAGWEREGQIRLLVLRNNFRRFRSENSAKIAKCAPKNSAARVILLDNVEHGDRFGEGIDLRTSNTFNFLRPFEDAIPAILRQAGLDWRTSITAHLRSWHHSVIEQGYVDEWLSQFEHFGVPWIGEHLLRTLDFWDPERLVATLEINEKRLEQFDCICLKRQQAGKSADFLGSLLRKRVSALAKNFPICDFVTTFNVPSSSSIPKRVLFIEDSLLTGTEMTNFLSGLLGLSSPGRAWPVSALQQPNGLLECNVEFQFPVTTSLGQFRLRAFLEANSFKHGTLRFGESGFIEVLTSSGNNALLAGQFFDPALSNCPIAPDQHLERVAFRGAWKKESRRLELEKFCREIGGQLFAEYLRQKGWDWPPQKIAASSLGMHGLGLNLAFSHSVPKASLPLLWASGTVKFDGSTIEWRPLFCNAAL
jgi:hypothetical protein